MLFVLVEVFSSINKIVNDQIPRHLEEVLSVLSFALATKVLHKTMSQRSGFKMSLNMGLLNEPTMQFTSKQKH